MGNIEEATFSIGTVVQIVIYTGGIVGLYFVLKHRISTLTAKCKVMGEQHEKDITGVQEQHDKDVQVLHQRIDKANENLSTKTDEITKKLDVMQKEIHDSKLSQEKNKNEILQAIANSK